MPKSRIIAALGAFFVLALAVAGCGSGTAGNTVATVAGNSISTRAFDHWMFVAAKGNATQSAGAPVIVPTDPPQFTGCIKQVRQQIPSLAKTPNKQIRSDCAQLFTSLKAQVMDFLIKAYWYQAEAYKLHIHLTNAQVQKAFVAAKKSQFPTTTAYTSFLTETGQTPQDILFRVRVNQIYKDLIARDTTKVTPATISAYYSAHQTQFGTPATRNLRLVLTHSQSQAQAALKALKSGQSWKAVAKQYSTDTSTKNNGGLLSGVTNGEEEHVVNQVAFSSPLNKLEGPIHGTFGWYVIEVIKITPPTHQSLTKATALIKQLLSSQSQTSAQTAVDKQAKKAWGSQTQCSAAYSMADCAGYKAPKTTTTATPSTATPTTSGGTATSSGGATVTSSGSTGTATSSSSSGSGKSTKKK